MTVGKARGTIGIHWTTLRGRHIIRLLVIVLVLMLVLMLMLLLLHDHLSAARR